MRLCLRSVVIRPNQKVRPRGVLPCTLEVVVVVARVVVVVVATGDLCDLQNAQQTYLADDLVDYSL